MSALVVAVAAPTALTGQVNEGVRAHFRLSAAAAELGARFVPFSELAPGSTAGRPDGLRPPNDSEELLVAELLVATA